MNDIREAILARLLVVCEGITGIVATGRNKLDVPRIQRPAILVLDGTEEPALERPVGGIRRFAQVQVMDLTPEIRLFLRADDGEEAGTLMSMFRARMILAIPSDATLQGLVTANGAIRYGGCSVPEPEPESKEPRMDLTFVFTYPLRLADLT